MAFAESFLQFPDLFPARPGGELWGTFEHRLDLPGGPFTVRGLSGAQQHWISQRYDREDPISADQDLAEDLAAAVTISVYRAAVGDFFDAPADDRWIDLDYTQDAVRIAGLGFMGRIEWRPELACPLWTSRDGDKVFAGCCENFLRVVLAYALLERGGALLHSAGVVDGTRAHLFVGRSGAGKSTLARLGLETGLEILSDDLNALLPASPPSPWWRAAKVPFTGELGDCASDADSYPVGGLYRLAQGSHHKITALDSGAALAALMACCPFVNGDPYRLDRLTDVLQQVVSELSVATLTFRLDSGLWQLLREQQATVANTATEPALPALGPR